LYHSYFIFNFTALWYVRLEVFKATEFSKLLSGWQPHQMV